jgi:hypothetical protein
LAVPAAQTQSTEVKQEGSKKKKDLAVSSHDEEGELYTVIREHCRRKEKTFCELN